MRRPSLVLLLLCVQAVLCASALAENIRLNVTWDFTSATQNNLFIRPLSATGKAMPSSIVRGTPKVGNLRLVKREKAVDTPVALVGVTVQGATVVVKVGAAPKKDATYMLFVESDAAGSPGIDYRKGGAALTYQNPAPVAVEVSGAPSESTQLVEITDRKFNSKGALALLAGTDGGAVAAGKLHAKLAREIDDQWFLSADAKADIAIQRRDVRQSFNSVTVDVDVTGIFKVLEPISLEERREGDSEAAGRNTWLLPVLGSGIEEFRFGGVFESDRAFKTIDLGVKSGLWLTLNNTVFKKINWLFENWGTGDQPFAPPPLLSLGYEYAAKTATGEGDSARVTDVGSNRGFVNLNWPLWLLRGLDLTATPLRSHYGVHFEADIGGIYDMENARFLPQTRLNLEIMPDEPARLDGANPTRPSLVFSYTNGKATPTFRNVDEILAGIKLPW